MSGQDLRKGSKILAADGSIVEVAHPPEVSEKRGKVVLQTNRAKFLGLWAIFSQTQSVKSECCESCIFFARKTPKANINRRWSEQIWAGNCTNTRHTHIKHICYCKYICYLAPLSPSFWMSSICKWCIPCRFSQVRNPSRSPSGQRDPWGGAETGGQMGSKEILFQQYGTSKP